MRKQLFDYLKETRLHWKLKQEALDHTLCRTSLKPNLLRHTPISFQQGAYELHSTTQTHPVVLIFNKNLNFICFTNI